MVHDPHHAALLDGLLREARGEKAPDFESFAKEIMEHWPEDDVYVFDLQEIAVRHRLIVEVPGGYNPEEHDDELGFCDPGDPWFERNYTPERE